MSARLDWLEARYRAGAFLTLQEHAELARLRRAAKGMLVDDDDYDEGDIARLTHSYDIATTISDAVDIAGDLLSGLSTDSPSIDTGSIDSTPDLGGGGGFGGGGGGDSF